MNALALTLVLSVNSVNYSVLPKEDLFQCKLLTIYENRFDQYRLGVKPQHICVYQCSDIHTQFEWYEKKKEHKGCKIQKKLYKM